MARGPNKLIRANYRVYITNSYLSKLRYNFSQKSGVLKSKLTKLYLVSSTKITSKALLQDLLPL